jgi:hypothetical protein
MGGTGAAVAAWLAGARAQLGEGTEGDTGPGGEGPAFYLLFGDTANSYSADNYTFDGCEGEAGLPRGRGTVRRARTWVWDKFSGLAGWAELRASAKLHSVEGTFGPGGVLCGRAELTHCNGVKLVGHFRAGLPGGLAMALFQDQVYNCCLTPSAASYPPSDRWSGWVAWTPWAKQQARAAPFVGSRAACWRAAPTLPAASRASTPTWPRTGRPP